MKSQFVRNFAGRDCLARIDLHLIFIIVGYAILSLYTCFRGLYLPDEGFVLSYSERILNAEVPYVDFFTVFAPGTFYLQAFLRAVFGDQLMVGRFFVVFQGLAYILLLYFLFKRSFGIRAGRLAALAHASWGVVQVHFPWYSWDAGFFFLLSLFFVVVAFEKRDSRWFYFFAGLAAGLSLLFKQNIGVFATAAFFASTLIFRLGFKNLLSFVVGNLFLPISYAAYLSLTYGKAGAFFSALFLEGAKQKGGAIEILLNPLPQPSMKALAAVILVALFLLVTKLLKLPKTVFWVITVFGALAVATAVYLTQYNPYLLLINEIYDLCILVSLLWLLHYLKKYLLDGDRDEMTRLRLLVGGYAFLSIYGGALTGRNPVRETMAMYLAMPLVFFAFEGFCYRVRSSEFFTRLSLPIHKIAIVGLVSFSIFGFFYKLENQAFRTWDEAVYDLETPVNLQRAEGLRTFPVIQQNLEAAVGFIEENTKPSDSIFVFPHQAILYFLADRKNPTPYDFFYWDILDASSSQPTLEALDLAKPPVVVLEKKRSPKGSSEWDYSADYLSAIHKYILDNYEVSQETSLYFLMKRKAS